MRINSFRSPGTLQDDLITLSPEESHHFARVLRVEAGQELTLFDGQGTRAAAVVDSVTKKEVTVRIVSRETVLSSAVKITLIQAICKPDRFELILQKATELGIHCIQPIITKNVSLPFGKMEKMAERGVAIIRNAAQQCGTVWMPEFRALQKMDAILSALGTFDLVLIGSLHPQAKPLREVFQTLEKTKIKTAALCIGPEGGFDGGCGAAARSVFFG